MGNPFFVALLIVLFGGSALVVLDEISSDWEAQREEDDRE